MRDLAAADIAVLKVQPLGGVRACLRIAEEIGLPVVVSSALETSVGIAAGRGAGGGAARAALRLRAGDRAAADRRRRRRAAAAGRRRAPGGPAGRRRGCPGPVGRASPDRVAWWEARLAAVRAVQQDDRRERGSAVSTWAPRRWSSGCSTSRRAPRSCCRPARATPRWRSRSGQPTSEHSSLHTRIDERSAGFLALGLSKVGARAAVICTSGTAVANLHPAVLEAVHAGVPLVVVSADRPPGCGRPAPTRPPTRSGSSDRWSPTYDVADACRPGRDPVGRGGPAPRQRAARRAAGAGGRLGFEARFASHLNQRRRWLRCEAARGRASKPPCRPVPAPSWSPATTPARRARTAGRAGGLAAARRAVERRPDGGAGAAVPTACCSAPRWVRRSSGSWSSGGRPCRDR